MEAVSENKEVLHCKGYGYEEIAEEKMVALLSELFYKENKNA